jgi:hypothetical protein
MKLLIIARINTGYAKKGHYEGFESEVSECVCFCDNFSLASAPLSHSADTATQPFEVNSHSEASKGD